MFKKLIPQAHAAITNLAIDSDLGSNAIKAKTGATFTTYFIGIWQALISVGGLLVLVYFLWGAISWITAGGDSSKVEKARDRIMQAIVGMIILASSFVILGFISRLFLGESFNILKFEFGF